MHYAWYKYYKCCSKSICILTNVFYSNFTRVQLQFLKLLRIELHLCNLIAVTDYSKKKNLEM